MESFFLWCFEKFSFLLQYYKFDDLKCVFLNSSSLYDFFFRMQLSFRSFCSVFDAHVGKFMNV